MKQFFITLMLMLTAISGWAQELKASDEKPIAPVIIEGNVERVPDGTVIILCQFTSQHLSPFGPQAKDTIRNGKFNVSSTKIL